jgi:hypothetical protein
MVECDNVCKIAQAASVLGIVIIVLTIVLILNM